MIKDNKYGSIHPILKYNNDLYEGKNAIKEHQKVIDKKGSVIWGVIKPKEDSPGVSSTKIEKMNKEIQENKIIYAFFSKKGKIEYYAKVTKVYDRDEIIGNKDKFPKYYNNDLNRCVAGFEITDFIKADKKISNYLRNHKDKNKEIVFSNQTNPLYSQIKDDCFFNENEKFSYVAFKESLENTNLKYSNEVILRFTASLITKPFVLLTGLSGSGKTKLAQAFVKWITQDSSQYSIVSVGANWTNRDPLLGYKSALEESKYIYPDNDCLDLLIEASKPENKDKPYFLILDEMNLSHVERYFSDFLSNMESNEPIRLHNSSEIEKVPKLIDISSNLFILGTVNIDETTYMFSPKVLDRANVIEFRVTKEMMKSFLKNPLKVKIDKLNHSGIKYSKDFISLFKNDYNNIDLKEDINKELILFFKELSQIGAEYGFRTASDIYRYIKVLQTIEEDIEINKCIDYAIVQKLLPKLHGSRKKLQPILKTLGNLCLKEDAIFTDYISENIDNDKIKYLVSLNKIERMYNRLLTNGFTSFAEA